VSASDDRAWGGGGPVGGSVGGRARRRVRRAQNRWESQSAWGPGAGSRRKAGALMVNILLHVAARCGGVASADVSAGADHAGCGGWPDDAGRGGRAHRSVF